MTAAATLEYVPRLMRRYAAAVAPAPKLSVSEWNDRFRILPPGEPEPGPWRTDRNPAFREPMDAFGLRGVTKITIMACAQSGKTAATMGMLAWAIDQAPGPMLLVLPDEDTAERRLRDKIKPMIEASPALRRYVTGWKSDWRTEDLHLTSCTIGLAWANSPAALADRSVRYAFADEIGKFPALVKKEGDPVGLLDQRTVAFGDRGKRVAVSTPTTSDSLLQREWEKSDQRRYWVPCPRCGTFQTVEFSQLKWPKVTADEVRLKRLAYYECAHCQAPIADTPENRHGMLHRGVWAPEGCTVVDGRVVGDVPVTDHRGYHLHGLLAFNRPWSDLAYSFRQSSRDRGALRNFHNSDLGVPFDEVVETVERSQVAERAQGYEPMTVPEGVRVLTAGVDVGKPHGLLRIHLVIRGWGPREESWLIHRDMLERWDAVEDLLFRRAWPRVDGKGEPLPVALACIDTGYETDEVYRFCAKWGGRARPIKGRADLGPAGAAYEVSSVELDRRGMRTRLGLQLFKLNTDFLKQKMTRFMRAPAGAHGQWHLHRDPGPEYCAQMASEHLVEIVKQNVVQRRWRERPGAPGNHYWDAEVYALAAAEMLHVYTMPDEAPAATAAHQQPSARGPRRGGDPGWMGGAGGAWVQGAGGRWM